jgi:DNA-binding response OmpR family regulator
VCRKFTYLTDPGGAAVADKASKTILVVDYDPVFRSSLVEILNQAGYKAYGAADGRSAIQIAGSFGNDGIDLMVLEMANLDMTGVEIIHAIAVQQKTNIKVIASSSLFSQADMDVQTSFRSHAGIRKEATATPAVASKWLLAARSLLGELADPAPVLSAKVILVADDDASLRQLVKVVLNREGYQVLESDDGESALALARRMAGAVDLVVTDIEMPGMNGRALGKAIRQEQADVPVIHMSGNVRGDEAIDLHQPEHGFAFIHKPFLPKALLEVVRSMLSRVKRAG